MVTSVASFFVRSSEFLGLPMFFPRECLTRGKKEQHSNSLPTRYQLRSIVTASALLDSRERLSPSIASRSTPDSIAGWQSGRSAAVHLPARQMHGSDSQSDSESSVFELQPALQRSTPQDDSTEGGTNE